MTNEIRAEIVRSPKSTSCFISCKQEESSPWHRDGTWSGFRASCMAVGSCPKSPRFFNSTETVEFDNHVRRDVMSGRIRHATNPGRAMTASRERSPMWAIVSAIPRSPTSSRPMDSNRLPNGSGPGPGSRFSRRTGTPWPPSTSQVVEVGTRSGLVTTTHHSVDGRSASASSAVQIPTIQGKRVFHKRRIADVLWSAMPPGEQASRMGARQEPTATDDIGETLQFEQNVCPANNRPSFDARKAHLPAVATITRPASAEIQPPEPRRKPRCQEIYHPDEFLDLTCAAIPTLRNCLCQVGQR